MRIEKYNFTHPEYPSRLAVKHTWLADILYSVEHDCYLSDEELAKIFMIPHEELRNDLEQILLYETGQTCGEISEERWNGAVNSVLLHCVVLLGELGNAVSLPVILLTLCQNVDFYEYHCGDIAGEIYIPTLYLLGKDHFDVLMRYMQTPGLYAFARINVVEAVALTGMLYPERRSEVIEWFRSLLVFYDGKLENCLCCDGGLIGMMTNSLIDLHAKELLPELKRLYDTQLVDEMCCGNFEEVVCEMNCSSALKDNRYHFNLHDRYAEFKRFKQSW